MTHFSSKSIHCLDFSLISTDFPWFFIDFDGGSLAGIGKRNQCGWLYLIILFNYSYLGGNIGGIQVLDGSIGPLAQRRVRTDMAQYIAFCYIIGTGSGVWAMACWISIGLETHGMLDLSGPRDQGMLDLIGPFTQGMLDRFRGPRLSLIHISEPTRPY